MTTIYVGKLDIFLKNIKLYTKIFVFWLLSNIRANVDSIMNFHFI
jgi:hypothetical protein